MNFQQYPWLSDLKSPEAIAAVKQAKDHYHRTGAGKFFRNSFKSSLKTASPLTAIFFFLLVTFPNFITDEALSKCVEEARSQEDTAFTTDGSHTAHLLPVVPSLPSDSVRNYEMRTKVASIAFDELPTGSQLASLYRTDTLLKLVTSIVKNENKVLYLSEDPIGCCSINVFRPQYHHSFHFDESEFSTTLMLQEASVEGTGLFQYTHPLRHDPDEMALESVAATLTEYDETVQGSGFCEKEMRPPSLHTLKFTPGTLSIFSGSKSLHRVTRVEGDRSRLVAIFTFASRQGFKNSP